MMNNIKIFDFKKEYAKSFHRCLDEVAMERDFLAISKAPPLGSIKRDFDTFSKMGAPNSYAFDDQLMVGWCDLRLYSGEF
jgi:hypothetical protein